MGRTGGRGRRTFGLGAALGPTVEMEARSFQTSWLHDVLPSPPATGLPAVSSLTLCNEKSANATLRI